MDGITTAEGVCRISAVGGGIGEHRKDPQKQDKRPRISVHHEQRHRIRALALFMNEMDTEPVNIRLEVPIPIEFCFLFAPVVFVESSSQPSLSCSQGQRLDSSRFQVSNPANACVPIAPIGRPKHLAECSMSRVG